jgi:RHH-type proline utilization regulon transcriptional repressor/proline dehydrogenase/delta 1-pyrroline-5-carboxylate dehydrogenase
MFQSFSSYFDLSEEAAVQAVLRELQWEPRMEQAVRERAISLVQAVRGRRRKAGQIETFLRQYGLDTEEGLALMTLAEALLRVPDKETANALIRDKVAAADWLASAGNSKDWLVKAAGVGLFVTGRTLESALGKIGEPLAREAMVRVMRSLGREFVLGADIEDAVQNAQELEGKGYRMSYDILGEGARTAVDAQRYFEAYGDAIDYIGARVRTGDEKRPGISVKLSALHPRYEFSQKERCVSEMAERLLALAQKAARYNLALTVDAEESERLDLSIQIFDRVLADLSLKDWDGFGLAVQAYHKAAPAVIDHVYDMAKAQRRRVQMRLVKGAYWDREIKRAQVEGLADFPVYTRKSHSDASYISCAARMFKYAGVVYPMFGTHNAHSVAAIAEMGHMAMAPYEFQRLFGMGEALFDHVLGEEKLPVSVYAPVGPHHDLLPYLVRRLLENGANSSFVNRIMDPDAPVEELVSDPVGESKNRTQYRHPKIKLPKALFYDEAPGGRVNSSGVDLHASAAFDCLMQDISGYDKCYMAGPYIAGRLYKHGVCEDIVNPALLGDRVGKVYNTDYKLVEAAFEIAAEGFAQWGGTDSAVRADALERTADLLEQRRGAFMALLIREAGKTISDALSEVREAVDFLRYYAAQGRSIFVRDGLVLPGPVGESNRFVQLGRGVFVCISPWNFPLAIFTGQVAAALMAGNSVLAKPAEQTPLVAMQMVKLLHEAGVLPEALHLLPGDGRIGAMVVQHKDVAGVAFTGSTAVAQEINRSLAAKNGPIVPIIAETGGQNAMIVDSSALPEQVVDDVIISAFGSAGQRCSALRVLCLQEEAADKIIRMLRGAMKELRVGDPADIVSDIGPVIDEEAHSMLAAHRTALDGFGKLVYEVSLRSALEKQGHYFAPCAYEIPNFRALTKEVFGPILHIIRYDKSGLDELLADIQGNGYGLTLGIHSRIESFHDYVAAKVSAGNVYVNRSMIGAVVGSQPFGGSGLSGTGPKAGGPHYLPRFASERVISVDTTAAGGNASLVSLAE